ncbi:amidohydrolase [Acidovorax sp. JHL-9]|uniref:amidohydrolase family protein n=1 Tax=Acidovorax sp. JHL-9 TaxID=1276756 RepID=UPI000427B647|nr:amidohydrolase family protein [Acidovorax sp. JHL-9]
MAQQHSPTLPAGSCDCHVHLYGPFDRFPADREGKFAPREEYPVERLFEVWDQIGVSRGVIVHAANAGADHEVTLDALRRYPDRLRAVAALKSDVSDRQLDRLTDAGFKGTRINLLRQDGQIVSTSGAGLNDLKALAPRLAERGWHAQLWVESGDLMALTDEIEKLPLEIVIDHQTRTMADKGVNYAGFQWFCEQLRRGRFWCKLSGADRNTRIGAPYSDTDSFMQALAAANPDRLVWGSDWPHVGHQPEDVPQESTLIEVFQRNVLDPATQHKILVSNPCRLYGFPENL